MSRMCLSPGKWCNARLSGLHPGVPPGNLLTLADALRLLSDSRPGYACLTITLVLEACPVSPASPRKPSLGSPWFFLVAGGMGVWAWCPPGAQATGLAVLPATTVPTDTTCHTQDTAGADALAQTRESNGGPRTWGT
ncbi:uncharacterized protein LOC128930292 isoform X1 [Callithrix jacchus]